MRFQDKEEGRKWYKGLTFLRGQSLKEFRPLQFESFLAISEAEQYDELFTADKQDYEYKKIHISKTRKPKHEFDLTKIDVEDQGKKKEKESEGEGEDNPAKSGEEGESQDVRVETPQEKGGEGEEASQTQQEGQETPAEGEDGVKERSPDVLSLDSSDESDEELRKKIENTRPMDQPKNEKPMDVFKSMYSEFKEIKKDAKTKSKTSVINRAKGFFGL